MRILHLSQAYDRKAYGGAEMSEQALIEYGIQRGHEIVSINAQGYVFQPVKNSVTRVGYDGFFLYGEWCDAVIIGNIEWLPTELMVPLLNRFSGRKPVHYVPRHFTQCNKIGFPGTTQELCNSECNGLYSCRNAFRWHYYRWLLNLSTSVVVASPLLQSTFDEAFCDEVDMGKFYTCPSPVDASKFTDQNLDRILDTVSVGGGTLQKGLMNHIKWAENNPDRNLTIYGRIEMHPQSLPKNITCRGLVNNDSLPAILNLYKTFLYYPACDEAYGRIVAEAVMCGCELDVDKDKIGALQYAEPIEQHQVTCKEKFWNIFEECNDIIDCDFEESTRFYIHQTDIDKQSTAIIISAHNQYEYTAKCFNSLEDSILGEHLIVFVDDGSTDHTKALHDEEFVRACWPNLNITVLVHEEPESCTACWNEALDVAELGNFDYYVIANNDTLFPRNWLKTLIEDQQTFDGAIVSPMSNCPGNRPGQEVERILFYELSDDMAHVEKTHAKLIEMNLLPMKASAVNGFCMLFPSSTVRKMQPFFNPKLPNFGNEDDLQKRMNAAGMESFISRRTFVFHYGNVSFNDRTNRGKAREDTLSVRAKGVDESYNTLTEALDDSDKVYLARFGDGEVALFENTYLDVHIDTGMDKNDPNLRREMTESFVVDDPNYLRAVSVNHPIEPGMVEGLFAPYAYNEDILKTVIENDTTSLVGHVRTYENQVMFHYLAVFKPDVFLEFLDTYMRPKKKMFIGCHTKKDMQKIFGKIDYYVNTPRKNSYSAIDTIWKNITTIIEEEGTPELIIVATGQTSNVIQKRLWNLDIRTHCIDIGSVVDAIVDDGVRTWTRIAGHIVRRAFNA